MAKAKKLPSGNWRAQVFAGMENGKKKYKSFTAPTRTVRPGTQRAGKREYHCEGSPRPLYQKQRAGAVPFHHPGVSHHLPKQSQIYYGHQAGSPHHRKDTAGHQRGRQNPPAQNRNIHGLLSSALAMFAPDIRLTTTLPQKKRPDYYTPTDKDVETLLKAVEGTELELPVLLASTGSLRRSEICALTQGDVSDLGVVVNKALVRGVGETWNIKTPKTTAGTRFVPLPPQVIRKLKAKGEGRICSLTPELLSKHFRLALERAGLPHFRLHDLRHYFASTLHAIGVPDKYIMLYGGWESESTLHGVYQHALRDRLAATDAQVVDYFSRVIGDENITRNTTQKK